MKRVYVNSELYFDFEDYYSKRKYDDLVLDKLDIPKRMSQAAWENLPNKNPRTMYIVKDTDKNVFAINTLANADTTVSLRKTGTETISINWKYTLDNGVTWNDWNPTVAITIPNGRFMKIKGTYVPTRNTYYSFVFNNAVNLSGNIMSLVTDEDYDVVTKIDNEYQFINLFGGTDSVPNEFVLNAKDLWLAANELSKGCYERLFYNCTNLVSIPSLEAQILADSCYKEIFAKCSALDQVVDLDVDQLENACYMGMFRECTNLSRVPALPATQLNTLCYSEMFKGCTKITAMPALPARELYDYCYYSMFEGCTSLNNFINILSIDNVKDYSYARMFKGCVLMTEPVEVRASVIGAGGCESMFEDCTSLVYPTNLTSDSIGDYAFCAMYKNCSSLVIPPYLKTENIAEGCYKQMFYGCTSLSRAPELPAYDAKPYCYQEMFYNCPLIDYIACSIEDITPTDCLKDWLYGVASTGYFKEMPNASWTETEPRGPSRVPVNWNRMIAMPFYFRNDNDEDITITVEASNAIRYAWALSNDGNTWSAVSTMGSISVPAHGFTFLKGTYTGQGDNISLRFSGSDKYSVGGYATSLLDPNDYATYDTIPDYGFMNLFNSDSRIIDASNLTLNATSVGKDGYRDMFYQCSNLQRMPKLNATTIGGNAYTAMFCRCISLKKLKRGYINVTTINGDAAMYDMFSGCTTLDIEEGVVLPATTLNWYSYGNMFVNCRALTTAPELKATTLAYACCNSMFQNTGLTTAPELLATTLVDSCYAYMFYGCANLNYIKCLATNISGSCTTNWVRNLSSEGQFVVPNSMQSAWDAKNVDSGKPEGWVYVDA